MINAKEFFQKDGVAPSRYKKVLDTTFGDEWYEWSGETLKKTVDEHFNCECPELVVSKMRAIQALRVSNKCYTDYLVFEKVVYAFNDLPVDWETVQRPEPEEIAYAVSCIKEIFPECEFGREVQGYVAAVFAEDGFVLMPTGLEFAQPMLDRLNAKSLAAAAKPAVEKAFEELKKDRKVSDGSTIVGHAISNILAVMAYVDKKRGMANV